jgi:hypothetical protein
MPACKNPYMLGNLPCPCGKCLPCKINKKRLWTHRLLLESYMHEKSSFVTLTYSDKNLPENYSLEPRELQLFIKRLRKYSRATKIRYYGVGEYGDITHRPHYHLALFGLGQSDREIIGRAWSRGGDSIGHVHIGDLNKDSSQYILGYTIKKMTSKSDERLNGRHPEFARMSTRPGIGHSSIKLIADALKQGKGQRFFLTDDGDVPISLMHGNRKLPLGRYMRDKLRQEMGISDEIRKAGVWKYTKELLEMYKNEKDDSKIPPEAKETIKKFLVHKKAQQVLNIEKRFDIFQKEKVL